ncbi:GFA family protein [Aidingimonas lacisalsi]|uniref:GFA family protein n=1 Tax=Aidingimonas lacisalsi TaxID=2604086 RepID=UPI0011D2A7D4|nr:GFA family protein [Aidingimonas lacisalsi]
MTTPSTYCGSCFCGAVRFTVSGAPEAMGYCHCESCRHWSAGPVNAFSLWKPECLRITQGADHIRTYSKTPDSVRQWCDRCGGHIFTEHPALGLVDVYVAVIPELRFAPEIHVHYQEARMHMTDGLEKFRDVPLEIGGSGERVTE